MKKIFFALLGCFIAICAHAAQIVNVDYVHKLIAQKWDISVPIKADNPMQVANMKYLLTAIDVANEILNGKTTTNYGDGEFATLQVADTAATNQAVETLVRKIDKGPEFTLTTTDDTNSFSFLISAAGEFVVDWGDGTVETITKPDTTNTTYSHNYATANTYTIGLSGQATAYNTDKYNAAISFYVGSSPHAKETNVKKIASIDGSLGAIFGTLADGSQPRFWMTFYNATNMKGSIPSDLFAGISGAPADSMFSGTFLACSKLTSIPENLFGNISGTAQDNMFSSMFDSCTSLTGPSARINGQYLYEIWPNATSYQVGDMYQNATGLSDYASIPTVWKQY